MALYDYGCPSCGNEEEVSHKITDTSEQLCKKCNTPMKKIIRPTNFKLAGGGWHSPGFQAKSK